MLRMAVAAVAFVAATSACGGGSKGPGQPAQTPQPPLLDTGPAPWPAPDQVTARIAEAGLPALTGERLEYHVHAHLDVLVNGISEPVPANIGIDQVGGRISPLHTHDETGIIHVESATQQTFSLGQFFTEWGVRLDQQCVGGYCSPQTSVLFYVNGQEWSGDPSTIPVTAHEEIAIVVGTAPAHIPGDYAFPAGY